MTQITIDTIPLQKALRKMLRKLEHREELMKRVAGDMMDAVEENFAQHGRPQWQQLAPSTIRARAKRGRGPTNILLDRGLLHNSISMRFDENQAVVGTNVPYAAIHQFGGTIMHYPQSRLMRQTFKRDKNGQVRFAKANKKGAFSTLKRTTIKEYMITIPARPFLKLVDSDIQHIEGTIYDFMAPTPDQSAWGATAD
jgi:phage virion morphogenesis protein